MSNDDALRYPVGKFAPKESYTSEELTELIASIEQIPGKIETLANALSPKQLDTPYREGGWTARQVLHHIADSHMNAYIRLKWTLTEETPLIKAYDEKAWATTPETLSDPALSIALIKALHTKWIVLMRGLKASDLGRAFTHPDTKKQVRIDRLIATYAWHGEHHLGHLKIVSAK